MTNNKQTPIEKAIDLIDGFLTELDDIAENNKQQTAVEWLIEKCACADLRPELWEIIKQQAKEMEIAGKEMSYADGYAEGYKRAMELVEWGITKKIKGNK